MNSFSPALSTTAAFSAPMGMGDSSAMGMVHMQANEFLPSLSPSPVYSTKHTVWSPQELQVFHKGLADYPADKYDNVTRYIKVAAMLPGKCVRDVAFKVKAMALARETMSMSRDQYAKRMKIVPYQYDSASSKLAFPTSSSTVMPTSGDSSADDAQFSALLHDNVLLLTTMRSNLLSGDLEANGDVMTKFRDNCTTVMSSLGDLSNAIPPLPIKLDTSLIPLNSSSTCTSANDR